VWWRACARGVCVSRAEHCPKPLLRLLAEPSSLLLQGVVDLVAMTGITWNGEELGASFDIGEIPESMKEQVGQG